jgi:hypothetical protein
MWCQREFRIGLMGVVVALSSAFALAADQVVVVKAKELLRSSDGEQQILTTASGQNIKIKAADLLQMDKPAALNINAPKGVTIQSAPRAGLTIGSKLAAAPFNVKLLATSAKKAETSYSLTLKSGSSAKLALADVVSVTGSDVQNAGGAAS